MLQEDYLESQFQYKIDEAAATAVIPSPEERPYDNYYKARDILKEVLADEVLRDESNMDVIALKAVLNFQLGQNLFETEETGAAKNYILAAMDYFSLLPVERMPQFFNHLLVCYNVLGLMSLNTGDQQKGLGFLLKAEKLYEKSQEILQKSKETCSNNMDSFSLKLKLYSSSADSKAKDPKRYAFVLKYPEFKPVFKFYYQGGLDAEALDKAFTLTTFYLAQAHATVTKDKDLSAYYCGITLKRQVDCGEYEPKDWANNSMGLAEYYNQEQMFSQALYIIFTALEMLPKDRHKKTKTSLRVMLGNIIKTQLEYNASLIKSGRLQAGTEAELQELHKYINRQKLKFEGISINFPETKIFKTYDEVKTLFKMAMTEYKKGTEVYVLDGFVTEHVNICKQMSSLYKVLSTLETEAERRAAMEFKRKELIDPLYKLINPKVYIGLWRELAIEKAAIGNSIFEIWRSEIFLNDKEINFADKKVRSRVKQMTSEGLDSIDTYEQICGFFGSEDYKSEADNDTYIQSMINAKFAIAKTYNGLVPNDVPTRVEYLKKSLEAYRYIRDFIKEKGHQKGSLNFGFAEQLKMCNEMIELLPTKIDKVLKANTVMF
jgi:KIF-binding protein